MVSKISVIDLFAGPGGLGEGFSAFQNSRNQKPFHIDISVEKEPSAHQTLQLRAFFRQFPKTVPKEYYNYVKGTISKEELFGKFPSQSKAAIEETLEMPRELGSPEDDRAIKQRLRALKKEDYARVLIGGPPCQAYSLVGRARNKGTKGYSARKDSRHFLYKEYLNILQFMQPEVFVMENVKGILSSKIDGQLIFPSLLEDLSHPHKSLGKKGGFRYKIFSLVEENSDDLFGKTGADYVIKSEKYGIPQARHRVILLGVREDIQRRPETLAEIPGTTISGYVLKDLPRLRSGLSKLDSKDAWYESIETASAHVCKALSNAGTLDFDMSACLRKSKRLVGRGGRFVKRSAKFIGPGEFASWYLDDKLDGFLNHESRGHIHGDLARYMFCSIYTAAKRGVSPKAADFPRKLRPNHKNWNSGKFVDRFKVQAFNKPSSTITSHISKDGHYYIHPDPSQCRSLTVREAARLQTFPDNYFFEGPRTQQYVQVGNAVPPLLAHQIAKIVHALLT